MPSLRFVSASSAGALLAGALMAAAPAMAQETLEELTVTGTYGARGEPQSLSAPVSFRDLDLTTKAGQDELTSRVRATAADLCEKLGEPRGTVSGSVLPSCRDEAVRNAQAEMRTAIAQATSRGPGWAPPAPEYAAAPPPPPAPEPAMAATTYAEPAAATTRLVTNGPVPDTDENRARFGGPMSNAGKRTEPAGN